MPRTADCAECEEPTPSNELQPVEGRLVCSACAVEIEGGDDEDDEGEDDAGDDECSGCGESFDDDELDDEGLCADCALYVDADE